jgi:hypothetical protein
MNIKLTFCCLLADVASVAQTAVATLLGNGRTAIMSSFALTTNHVFVYFPSEASEIAGNPQAVP